MRHWTILGALMASICGLGAREVAPTVVVDEPFDFFNGAVWTDQVTRDSGFLQVTGGHLVYFSLDPSATRSAGLLGLRSTSLTYNRPWSLALDFASGGFEVPAGGHVLVGLLGFNRNDPADYFRVTLTTLPMGAMALVGLVVVDAAVESASEVGEAGLDRHIKLYWDPASKRLRVFSALDGASPLVARAELDLSGWSVVGTDSMVAGVEFGSGLVDIPWGACSMDRFVATLDDPAPIQIQAPALHPSHDAATGMFGLAFVSQANVRLVVETSEDLVAWREHAVIEAAPDDHRRFLTLPADRPRAFFRLRAGP